MQVAKIWMQALSHPQTFEWTIIKPLSLTEANSEASKVFWRGVSKCRGQFSLQIYFLEGFLENPCYHQGDQRWGFSICLLAPGPGLIAIFTGAKMRLELWLKTILKIRNLQAKTNGNQKQGNLVSYNSLVSPSSWCIFSRYLHCLSLSAPSTRNWFSVSLPRLSTFREGRECERSEEAALPCGALFPRRDPRQIQC